jgi:hypothetical protein
VGTLAQDERAKAKARQVRARAKNLIQNRALEGTDERPSLSQSCHNGQPQTQRKRTDVASCILFKSSLTERRNGLIEKGLSGSAYKAGASTGL